MFDSEGVNEAANGQTLAACGPVVGGDLEVRGFLHSDMVSIFQKHPANTDKIGNLVIDQRIFQYVL
jgi:hypothetical protein